MSLSSAVTVTAAVSRSMPSEARSVHSARNAEPAGPVHACCACLFSAAARLPTRWASGTNEASTQLLYSTRPARPVSISAIHQANFIQYKGLETLLHGPVNRRHRGPSHCRHLCDTSCFHARSRRNKILHITLTVIGQSGISTILSEARARVKGPRPAPALLSVRFCARGTNSLTTDMRSGVLFDTETLRDAEEEEKKQKNVKMRKAEKQRLVPRPPVLTELLSSVPLFSLSLLFFLAVSLSPSVALCQKGLWLRPAAALRCYRSDSAQAARGSA